MKLFFWRTAPKKVSEGFEPFERLSRHVFSYLHIKDQHIGKAGKLKINIFQPPPYRPLSSSSDAEVAARHKQLSVNRFEYCGADFCKKWALSNGIPAENRFVGLALIELKGLEEGYSEYLSEIGKSGISMSGKLVYEIKHEAVLNNDYHANINFNRPLKAGEPDEHYKLLAFKLLSKTLTYFDISKNDNWQGDSIPKAKYCA